MNDARVRRMPMAQKAANAFALLALAILLARLPADFAPVLVGLAVPVALALVGGTERARAGVVARGWAIFANLLGVLAGAGLVLATGLGVAHGLLDLGRATGVLALAGPLLVLYVLNLRRLVGPPVDAPRP